jgi:hypothetical protein
MTGTAIPPTAQAPATTTNVSTLADEDKKPDIGKKADSETGVPDQKAAA